jgi:hypoxanthine phosphoribosyltransferase
MNVLINTDEIQRRVVQIAGEIEADRALDGFLPIAIREGALPFARDLLKALGRPEDLETVTISSYVGERVARQNPVLLDDVPPSVAGRSVLVIEDILDTGRTLTLLREELLRAGAVTITNCVLLDKRRDRISEVDAKYVGFEIEDVFVVGYGLDYESEFRDLPYIAIMD